MIYWHVLLWAALFSCLIISFYFLSWFMRWNFCLFYISVLFVNHNIFVQQWCTQKKWHWRTTHRVYVMCVLSIIYGETYQRNQFGKQRLVICKEQMLQSALCGFACICLWICTVVSMINEHKMKISFFLLSLCTFPFSLLKVESYPLSLVHRIYSSPSQPYWDWAQGQCGCHISPPVGCRYRLGELGNFCGIWTLWAGARKRGWHTCWVVKALWTHDKGWV